MIPFTKAHACGNDFLLLEEADARWRHTRLAQRLCARHIGLGADGIEFIDRARSSGELFLRLFNADGSEAELSGNGTRCVAAYLAHTEGRREVTLGTHGGARHCRVLREQGSTYEIESGMGIPRVMPRTLRMELAHGETAEVVGAMVNVGNPHFVVRVETDDFSAHGLSWQELGARIAVDPRFPHGTNVEFVHVLAPDRIAFRIFERGCGPTTSSGTGTCASAAMTMALHGVNRKLVALAEGGPQEVAWPSNADELRLTGPAELLCQGFAFDGAEAALDSREGLDL